MQIKATVALCIQYIIILLKVYNNGALPLR